MSQIIETIAQRGNKIRNAFFLTEREARRWINEYYALDWAVDLVHRDTGDL
jgi:hypothetical protein